jgi:ribonuclease E
MLHFDKSGELKGRFLITAVQRNRNPQLRLRALTDVAALRNAGAFDTAVDIVGTWNRDERREGVKVLLRALAERRIGRRDQANAWIWRMAEYTRETHEEYAVQRWPETKRLLGLLVNSSGSAHARNARKLVHASRKQDRPPRRRPARGRARAHPRGRRGAAGRKDTNVAQAAGACQGAAAQLPQTP